METTYPVCLGNDRVGTVTLEEQGLYYKITCSCSRTQGMFDLYWQDQDLGILRPQGLQQSLQTKIPRKRAPEQMDTFCIRPRHERMGGRFVPLSPKEPFSYLQDLETAYLETRQGRTGLVFPVQKNVK